MKNMTKNIVMMTMTPEISAYLKTAIKTPLSVEQERQLIEEYKSGNDTAKANAVDLLTRSNLLFIYSKAKSYAKGDTSKVLDICQQGSIGIINALEKFDLAKNYRFITFAQWYIMQEMTQYSQTTEQFIRKTNNAKIGNNVYKIRAAFLKTEGREPSLEEIQEELAKKGIKIKDLRDLEDSVQNSLESSWGDDSTFENNPKFLKHSSVDNEFENEVEAEDNRDKVSKLLNTLDERSKNIVKALFGIGRDGAMDIETVAEIYGLTTTRVGQIKKAALKKMAEAV